MKELKKNDWKNLSQIKTKMNRVSSQLTIVLRIVLPTIWLTSIVSTIILLMWAVRGKAGLFGNPYIWIGIAFIIGSGVAIVKIFLLRLYRIDLDKSHLYISNYFKTYKYPYSEVESIQDSKVLPGRIYCITLRSKGSFGKNIYFLTSQALWADFKSQYPGLIEGMMLEK